jgi:hypothetical protein
MRVTTVSDDGAIRLGAIDWVMNDFESVIYYPAKAFVEGHNPYDNEQYLARYPSPGGFYVYPPIILLLGWPWGALPLSWAVALKVAFSLILTGVLAFASLRLAGARGRMPAVLFVAALILLSRPGQWNLLLGQVTLPVVLATYAALVLGDRRTWAAGCALAIALVKPNFGLPLAVAMLALRQGKAVAAGTALMLALNLPLVAVLANRAGSLLQLIEHAGGGGHPITHVESLHTQLNYHRVDAVALLSQLLPHLALGATGTIVVAGLVLGAMALVLRTAGRRPEQPVPHSPALSLSTAAVGLALSGILLCGYHVSYDLLLLTWPFVGLVLQIRAAGRETPVRRWVALGLFAVLAGNYLATTRVIEGMNLHPAVSLTFASLNGLALSGLFLFYLYELAKPELGIAAARHPVTGVP